MYHNLFKAELFRGNVDFVNDTIKIALLTPTHSIDIDTQDYWDDVSANEITDGNYSAGGQTVSFTVTEEDANDRGVIDAPDITFTLTGPVTSRYAVLYKDTGVAGTSVIIDTIDFGEDKITENGDLDINLDAQGYGAIS